MNDLILRVVLTISIGTAAVLLMSHVAHGAGPTVDDVPMCNAEARGQGGCAERHTTARPSYVRLGTACARRVTWGSRSGSAWADHRLQWADRHSPI
jgi:hypothetical protein